MVSHRPAIHRANISIILQFSEVLDVARELSGNMEFGGNIESIPSCVKGLSINKAHKNVCVVKTFVIANVTIDKTICIVCKNFGHRHSCILSNIKHILGLDDVDVRAKFDDDFKRYFHYSDTMTEDQVAFVLAAFLDGCGMGQAKLRSREVNT